MDQRLLSIAFRVRVQWFIVRRQSARTDRSAETHLSLVVPNECAECHSVGESGQFVCERILHLATGRMHGGIASAHSIDGWPTEAH